MVKIRFGRMPTAGVRTTQGFTYLTGLFIVAILAGSLVLVSEVWHTSAMREKEAELLWIGHQYRKAIGAYYEATPGNVKRYPQTLEDLLKDGRGPGTERHMRKSYPDPIAGKNEWGLVKAPDGGILGVYSLSNAGPLRTAHFRVRDAAFEDTQKYSEWAFVHTPPAQPSRRNQNPKPAAK